MLLGLGLQVLEYAPTAARPVRPVGDAVRAKVGAAAARVVDGAALPEAAHDDARHDRVPRHAERLLERAERREQKVRQQVRADEHRGQVQREEAVQDQRQRVVRQDLQRKGRAAAAVRVRGVEAGDRGRRRAVEQEAVDVVLQDLAGDEGHGNVLGDLPRERQGRGGDELGLSKRDCVGVAACAFDDEKQDGVEEREENKLRERASVSRRQAGAAAVLDGLGDAREADVKEQKEERRDEPEDEADGGDADEMHLDWIVRHYQGAPRDGK